MLTETMKELRALRLGPMADHLAVWVGNPDNARKSAVECVLAIAQAQAQATVMKRKKNFMTKADLPSNIGLSGVNTGAGRGLPAQLLGNLSACEWIRNGQTVVITGASQTGKTYLAGALAQHAAQLKLRVEYRRVPELLVECALHQKAGTLTAFMKPLTRAPLLVLDDFAMQRASLYEGYWLRQILDVRKRNSKAVMIVSPNQVEEWGQFFEDATTGDQIYGRVLTGVRPIVLKHPRDIGAPRTKAKAGRG